MKAETNEELPSLDSPGLRGARRTSKWVKLLRVEKAERQLLHYLKTNRLEPQQRLISEQQLARVFKVSAFTVHRAVCRLVEKGYLYTQPRRGLFVSDRSRLGLLHERDPARSSGFGPIGFHEQPTRSLVVRFPENLVEEQQRMWQKVIAAFHEEFPFLRVHPRFENQWDERPDDTDILFFGAEERFAKQRLLQPLKLNGKQPLAETLKNELFPGFFDLLQTGGKLHAIPLLRTTTMVYLRADLFQQCGITPETIRRPTDLMRAGHAIEERSGPSVRGILLHGFVFHAPWAGVRFARQGDRLIFDVPLARNFLEECRLYIRPHHFDVRTASTQEYWSLMSRYAIVPDYSYYFPPLVTKEAGRSLMRIPLAEGGTVGESCWMGGIARWTPYADDAQCFLAFVISRKGQEAMCESHPHWLSVRPDVLAWQKIHSPFPQGAVVYDFNPDGYKCDGLEAGNNLSYKGHLNFECLKYFKGLQDIDETLEKMSAAPPSKNIRP